MQMCLGMCLSVSVHVGDRYSRVRLRSVTFSYLAVSLVDATALEELKRIM